MSGQGACPHLPPFREGQGMCEDSPCPKTWSRHSVNCSKDRRPSGQSGSQLRDVVILPRFSSADQRPITPASRWHGTSTQASL